MGINSVDDFLKHRSGEQSGGMLNKWKKGGKVDTWMHTRCLPVALWRHGAIPRTVLLEDKDTREQVKRVFGGQWVCLEDESVLKVQYRRKDGRREREAHYCPICRLLDAMRDGVESGRMTPWTPVFKFEGDDPDETVVLHAGGLYMTRKDIEELEDEERRNAKKAGVRLDEFWKETGFAKLGYLFRVVDNAHPEAGVQVAIETQLLGDRVKDVIADRQESFGVEEGDPFKNPYAIQWEYREQEKVPTAKYKARPLDKVKLTPAINELIHGDAPGISKYIEPFNVKEMRAYLEKHALVKLPFDEIFDVKVRKGQGFVDEAPAPKPLAKVQPKSFPKAPPPPSSKALPEADDDMVECDECGAAMSITATKCGACGAEYGPDGKIIPKEKVAPRKRSDVAKAMPKAAVKYSREPGDDHIPDPDPSNGMMAGESEDDIPF